MRRAKAEWCDCSECCMARLPVWDIRQLHCSGSSTLGEGRRQNKGLVRKGRSGLIESFGPRLHWSETCYRNPVSWFPNNEISEKGYVVLWDSILTFLWFLWFSLGCLPPCSSVLNPITMTIWKHCGWVQQVVFTYITLQWCCECEYTVWCLRCGFFVRASVCFYMNGACLASIWIFSSWCWLTTAFTASLAIGEDCNTGWRIKAQRLCSEVP